MSNKVSIIIPVYNTKKEYLKECFESIDNQTYKNFEVVIVDDGSKQEIADFLDTYNKKEKYKVFHKKNEGVSTARNFGIDNSTGAWLMFVDSDDFISENALERLIQNSEDMDIVIGGVKRTNITKDINFEEHIFEKYEVCELIKSIFQAKSGKYQYVDGLWGKLYNRNFWKKYNLKLKKELRYGEDATLNLEAYINANKIKYFSEVVYFWRTNDESVTAKYNPILIDEQEKVLKNLKDKFPRMIQEYEKEFIAYISKAIKNIIKNIYSSTETTKQEKRDLVKRLIKQPVFKECIESNLYNEIPNDRKIILVLLRYRLFTILEVLLKGYKKIHALRK